MPDRSSNTGWVVIGGSVLAMAGLGAWQAGLNPIWAYLAGINACTLSMYALDKLQARRDRWRIPESILHLAAALGGSPGALLGQMVFRHKTQKKSFRRVCWLIVALQVAGLGLWWFASQGGD